MKISEIQTILDQLKERHPELSEKLLFKLLSAGGWNDLSIKEALILFKAGENRISLSSQDNISLPELSSILMVGKNNDNEELIKESLIVYPENNIINNKTKEEVALPDDLPIKIIESSPNVWHLSAYKEAFHGDEKVEEIDEEKNPVKRISKDEINNIHKRKTHNKKSNNVTLPLTMFLLVVFIMFIYMFFK